MLSGLGVMSPMPPSALTACSTNFRLNPISISCWTVDEGGGEAARPRGRERRRESRRSRDVTAGVETGRGAQGACTELLDGKRSQISVRKALEQFIIPNFRLLLLLLLLPDRRTKVSSLGCGCGREELADGQRRGLEFLRGEEGLHGRWVSGLGQKTLDQGDLATGVIVVIVVGRAMTDLEQRGSDVEKEDPVSMI